MKLKSLKDIKSLKNKTVLVRVDYNVAIKNGKVLEIERIERSFATINYLLKNKAKVILISHLGSPGGKKIAKFSLKPVFNYLNKISKQSVCFADDCVGVKVRKQVGQLKAGQILLLENLRFHPGEEKNDAKFAWQLASSADIYVNEAFSVCHRAHASVLAITGYLPSYGGFNLVNEVENLSRLLKGFKRPAVAIIGGVKISTKIEVLENLLKKYDKVLIGGALANNFLAAQKVNIGKSFVEKDFIGLAKKLQAKFKRKLILPVDFKISRSLKSGADLKIFNLSTLKMMRDINFYLVDIGPKTELLFESFINASKTIVWNGPMGIFEVNDFSHGTDYIARAVALQAKGPAFGVVGGGETVAVLEKLGNKSWLDFVSTAGGAMLEFLEGKILPGIKPLIKK
jgi:3-phosphoglycerate kinase